MVRRYVEGRCLGRTITRVQVLDGSIIDGIPPDRFARSVHGKMLRRARRHGKQLFIDLGDMFMAVHLGMTGDLLLLERGERLPPHARVIFSLDDKTRLVYDDPRKFGAVGVASSIDEFVQEHRLGPDALKVPRKEFVERSQRSRRSIKAVLLDQHVVAGVGNLYADESLFQSKLHPLTPSAKLSEEELGRLWSEIRRVLRASIKSSTDFQKLPEDFLLRSRSAGSRCPRGNGMLEYIRVAGRTTIFCPVCQTHK